MKLRDFFTTASVSLDLKSSTKDDLLKELVATGEVSGNITTLEDYSVIADLQKNLKK